MNTNKINKCFLNLIIASIYVFIIVIFSGSVWQVSSNLVLYNYILLISSVIIFIYTLINKKTVTSKIRIKEITLIYFILTFLWTYLSNYSYENINFYFSLISMVLFSYSITELINITTFLKYFKIIISIISIISLIYYIFLNYTSIHLNLIPFVSNNNILYNKGFLFFSLQNPIRNIGVFWEPGVFASILLFVLIFQVLISRKLLSGFNILVITTLITTRSTAGYVLLILFLLAHFFSKKNFKYIIKSVTILISVILLLIIIDSNLLSLSSDSVFSKLWNFNMRNIRIETIKFNFNIFMKSPLIGSGFVNVNRLTSLSNIFIDNEAIMQTSTSSYFLASAGILGLGYTIIWIITIFKIPNLNQAKKVILILLMLSIINKEIHISILITYILLFYLQTLKFNRITNYEIN